MASAGPEPLVGACAISCYAIAEWLHLDFHAHSRPHGAAKALTMTLGLLLSLARPQDPAHGPDLLTLTWMA